MTRMWRLPVVTCQSIDPGPASYPTRLAPEPSVHHLANAKSADWLGDEWMARPPRQDLATERCPSRRLWLRPGPGDAVCRAAARLPPPHCAKTGPAKLLTGPCA